MITGVINYRIAGHESFSFRYAWLPKAVRRTAGNEGLFADEDQAMVEFGVGKNMVRSIRFWSQAAGLLRLRERGLFEVTDLGHRLLGDEGLDPFVEDTRTFWLIHWQLSRETKRPLLAWHFLLNRWPDPDLTVSKLSPALCRELVRTEGKNPSRVTVERHLDVFFKTYVSGKRARSKVLEDTLDCPLAELELLKIAGSSVSGPSHEMVYRFRREEKSAVSVALFAWCLEDFWERQFPHSKTLSLKEIAHGSGSPGQIFQIPEVDIRCRMEAMDASIGFAYTESAASPSLRRTRGVDSSALLEQVYAETAINA